MAVSIEPHYLFVKVTSVTCVRPFVNRQAVIIPTNDSHYTSQIAEKPYGNRSMTQSIICIERY
jgi:hypothetical protein